MATGIGIAHVAVVADRGAGDACRDGVAEVAAEVEPALVAAVVADGQLHRAALVVEGILGGELDRAAGGVLAVPRALRTAPHFPLPPDATTQHPPLHARCHT